jgi:DNA sulfur modification protein DndB
MAPKTLFPAIKARVGDWQYYICSMKYSAVARELASAFELALGNRDLSLIVEERVLDRARVIVDCLRHSSSRFLNAITIACREGQHRLKAIKEALKHDPSLGNDDLCVLIVNQSESDAERGSGSSLYARYRSACDP